MKQPDEGVFAHLAWSDRDAHRWATWLALLALTVAAALAIVTRRKWTSKND